MVSVCIQTRGEALEHVKNVVYDKAELLGHSPVFCGYTSGLGSPGWK
jgi:hypothetical protein